MRDGIGFLRWVESFFDISKEQAQINIKKEFTVKMKISCMISSTFQPWPILSSSGPPLTCHVPDLFSRASEFLHNYCVRWALGGSHGVAPA